MVFGWGKKKEDDSQATTKQIHTKDIPKIIDEILNRRTNQMLAEIKSLRDSTDPLIKELAKIGKTLEKDNLAVDEIDKHLRIIVVRGKQQVIDVIKKDTLNLPQVSTIEDTKILNDALNQILKKIGDVLGRQTRVIHIFAKKYAEQLKQILAQMNSNHFEIRQMIKNYDDAKVTYEQITDSLKALNNYDEELEHHTQRISEINKDIESLEGQILSLNASIDKIKSSKEFSDYESLRHSLEQLGGEKTQIKNHIGTQFTKISRPLSRYEYISSDKDQKNLLVKLVEDPVDVLVSKNRDMIIVILENVRKGILSGSISVKDIEKSMDHITETVEMIDSFIRQVDEFKEKVRRIEEQMNQFDRTALDKFEKDLEKALHEKEEYRQKITSFTNEADEIRSKIPSLLTDIESKLRQFSSVQYTLVKPP